MNPIIQQRYMEGEAIARLAREFGIPYGTLRQRLLKSGVPARKRGQHESVSEIDRFWKYAMPEPNSGCWLWVGKQYRNGYGAMFFRGTTVPAHRASWQLFCGAIPEEMEIDHRCKNRPCVNPEHLRLATKAENLANRHLLKSHCRNGHPFTADNCYFENDGNTRRCKTCRDAARSGSKSHERASANQSRASACAGPHSNIHGRGDEARRNDGER